MRCPLTARLGLRRGSTTETILLLTLIGVALIGVVAWYGSRIKSVESDVTRSLDEGRSPASADAAPDEGRAASSGGQAASGRSSGGFGHAVATAKRGDPADVVVRDGVTDSSATLTFEQRVQRAKVVDVPWREQEGPKCALYAFGMVSDFWARKTGGKSKAPPVNGEGGIFEMAKERGYTKDGGITLPNLGRIAQAFGYKTKYSDDWRGAKGMDDLKAALARKHPVIIVFDVDKGEGNPGDFGGERAHAAVIQGVFKDVDGQEYVIAKHGWYNKDYVWRVEDFEKSWKIFDRPMLEVWSEEKPDPPAPPSVPTND